MKALIVFMAGALLLCGAPANAAENGAPWDEAVATRAAIETDLQRGGIQTLGAYVDRLEAMIAEAGQSTGTYDTGDTLLVLADGQTEVLAAMILFSALQVKKGEPRQVAAVNNPYPPLALYLGAYYNEVGSHTDALRILEAGIALPRVLPDLKVGEHLPLLMSERGAALNALMRWEDSLAAYDEGLTIPELEATDRARFLRGRGFALVELGRLDEASQAYSDSLESEPNNPVALQEMDYIDGLRAGGPAAAPQLFAPGQEQQP